MDALISPVRALAAGAVTALKPTVEQAVKDSYIALKGVIQRKYAQVNLDQLEAHPCSMTRRGVVEEDLATAGTDKDAEVLQQTQALLSTSAMPRLVPLTTRRTASCTSSRHVTSNRSQASPGGDAEAVPRAPPNPGPGAMLRR